MIRTQTYCIETDQIRRGRGDARRALIGFVSLIGMECWAARIADILMRAATGPRAGQVVRQRHAIELTLDRLRRGGEPASAAEHRLCALAAEAVALERELPPQGAARLHAMLGASLIGDANLVGLFHLLSTALRQRANGFVVRFAGFADEAPYDLLLRRDQTEAELACDLLSAEEGRSVHRGAWYRLADRIDPDLQTWLAAHPGRYLLKLTLPRGLRCEPADDGGDDALAMLHQRICRMLHNLRRSDHDEAVVLRLDPLLLAAAQADELGLVPRLRREFGPEAHLSVTTAGDGVFVMAARAGRANEVAISVRRRLAYIAPRRLTGTRPGILALFIEDTDRAEWRALRERLELEAETRQFLTQPAARPVVAVTCTSRLELLGLPAPDAEPDGELRFRNPAHPAARVAALASAVS